MRNHLISTAIFLGLVAACICVVLYPPILILPAALAAYGVIYDMVDH